MPIFRIDGSAGTFPPDLSAIDGAMDSTISKFLVAIRSSIRDVLLIVIGILIAFLLDAWWDDRLDQLEFRETKQAIYSDFLSTQEELNPVVAANPAHMTQQERSVELGIYLTIDDPRLSDSREGNDREILRTVIQDDEILNRLAAHTFAV